MAAVAAAALIAIAIAGCGGGGGGGGATTPAPSPTTAQETPSTPNVKGSGPADPVAAEAEVKTDWEKFFDPSTSLQEKTKLLQHGDQLQPLVQGFAGDKRVGQVKADVSTVTFTSEGDAVVKYTLTLKGQPVVTNATGAAVLEDGTWKVALKTLCGLIQQDPNAPKAPGCS